MSLFDAFRFDRKRVVVLGGASGMGAAAAELALDAGAEVVVLDRADPSLAGAKAIRVDLAERASVDAAVIECGGPVHALLCCAGVADGTPGIERINFVGHRHLVDRMVDAGMLARGGAIAFVSSAAGLGWEANLAEIQQLLALPGWDDAAEWMRDNGYADYFHTKQAVCAYVAAQAHPMLKRGLRINAVCPGPTETPLARANEDLWLGFGADYRADVGIDVATPLEQAYPLLFLCSDAASAVNGVTLVSDGGYLSAGVTGAFPPATATAQFLLGRLG